MTHICVFMGHLQNDVIGASLLVKMKNGWHNYALVLNFLSFRVHRVLIGVLVRFLYAFKFRKCFHIFSTFQKNEAESKGKKAAEKF